MHSESEKTLEGDLIIEDIRGRKKGRYQNNNSLWLKHQVKYHKNSSWYQGGDCIHVEIICIDYVFLSI